MLTFASASNGGKSSLLEERADFGRGELSTSCPRFRPLVKLVVTGELGNSGDLAKRAWFSSSCKLSQRAPVGAEAPAPSASPQPALHIGASSPDSSRIRARFVPRASSPDSSDSVDEAPPHWPVASVLSAQYNHGGSLGSISVFLYELYSNTTVVV